ncbi:MAG: NUDIX hydrolase [Oleiphilus sp.]
MIWTPHATVAAIVEREGRFLLVEELSSRGDRVFNQPAGHIEEDESVVTATKRETLEESGWHVEVSSLVGIYTYKAPSNGVTYYRLCYACEALNEAENPQLDEGIIAAHWLTIDEILARKAQLRSPLVLKCFEDYLAGKRYPLDILYEHPVE